MVLNVAFTEHHDEGDTALNEARYEKSCLAKDVEPEVVVIADADAIVDPGAVVVKALNTLTAHRAVPTTTRSDRTTVRAKLCAFNIVKHIHKVNSVVDQIAW